MLKEYKNSTYPVIGVLAQDPLFGVSLGPQPAGIKFLLITHNFVPLFTPPLVRDSGHIMPMLCPFTCRWNCLLASDFWSFNASFRSAAISAARTAPQPAQAAARRLRPAALPSLKKPPAEPSTGPVSRKKPSPVQANLPQDLPRRLVTAVALTPPLALSPQQPAH